jgi:transketolase
VSDVFLVTVDEYCAASGDLRELARYNRINALSCIHHTGRGWIGACLSATEVLTALYFDVAREDDAIVLGKGHAAAMQYACLAGAGRIPVEDLLRYKHPDGPQAHTDVTTNGIAANTGSLGQALSKCCGLAMACPDRNVYAILGDGELQEGQCFEALQTMHAHGVSNLVAVIDRNGIQSDSDVADIKAIPDLEGVIRGFGPSVERVDGNDVDAVRRALVAARDAKVPSVVVADTVKGAGVSFMAASSVERRGYAWHGKAPDRREYGTALLELRACLESRSVGERLDAHLSALTKKSAASVTKPRAALSTGTAFGEELVRLGRTKDDLYVFDADLEKPCKLGAFASAFPERFVEMGISEQDMVSCAGGYALCQKLPVVNTYGSFFKRALEQVYVNATERTKILYAGHYCGLCYGPDGKTHSSTGDLGIMRAIPGMVVLYPAYVEEVAQMLEWFVASCDGGAYMRLHRAGSADLPVPEGGVTFRPGVGQHVMSGSGRATIVTSGPHMTRFCAAAARTHGLDLYAVPWYGMLDEAFVRGLRDDYETLFVIEEHMGAGGLLDVVAGSFGAVGLRPPRLVHKAVRELTFSTLEPDGLYEHFGLDADALTRFVAERLSPGSECDRSG